MSPVKKQDKHRNKKVAKQNQGRSYASYSLMAIFEKVYILKTIHLYHHRDVTNSDISRSQTKIVCASSKYYTSFTRLFAKGFSFWLVLLHWRTRGSQAVWKRLKVRESSFFCESSRLFSLDRYPLRKYGEPGNPLI